MTRVTFNPPVTTTTTSPLTSYFACYCVGGENCCVKRGQRARDEAMREEGRREERAKHRHLMVTEQQSSHTFCEACGKHEPPDPRCEDRPSGLYLYAMGLDL